MAVAIDKEITEAVARANYCFWLRSDVDRTIPVSLVGLVVVVSTLNFSLLGKSDSVFAGAVYALYLLLSLSITGIIVFLRTHRLESSAVLCLIEAYVVALLISMVLMTHNLFWPIPFFGIAVRADKWWEPFAVVYGYALPAAVYLFANSRRVLATSLAIVPAGAPPLSEAEVQAKLREELPQLVLWAIVHYVAVGFLVWLFLFADPHRINEITKILPA